MHAHSGYSCIENVLGAIQYTAARTLGTIKEVCHSAHAEGDAWESLLAVTNAGDGSGTAVRLGCTNRDEWSLGRREKNKGAFRAVTQ